MKSIFLFFLFCYTISLRAQPVVSWSKFYGNNAGGVGGNSVISTPDGGYLAIGTAQDDGGDVSGYHGGSADVWLLKTNALGVMEWQKCLGGSNGDFTSGRGSGGGGLQATADGGYIMSLSTNSSDGDVSNNKGGMDVWVVKINATGAIQWERSFGGNDDELDYKIKQTPDGGYLMAGSTRSNNTGDVSGAHGGMDVWVVKLNNAGVLQWQRCLGSSANDLPGNFVITPDGGCVLALATQGNDGDVSGNHNPGRYDYWIVKLDNAGVISWQKCLGGTDDDMAQTIVVTPGGYAIAGDAYSIDGDVVNPNNGQTDCWVVQINSTGTIQWERCVGGWLRDMVFSLERTADGGLLVGNTVETVGIDNGDITGTHDELDAWLVKLSSSGALQWQKCLGGSLNDWLFDAIALPGGNYVVLGESTSQDGDAAGNPWTDALSLTYLRTGSILPVDFRDFTGRKAGTDVLLAWQVADVDEGGKFIIERSTDGVHFVPVATLPQTSDHSYQYRDLAILSQAHLLYYRIMAQDVNNHKKYTQVVRIETTINHGALQLMGNPVKDQLRLQYYSDGPDKLALAVLDQQGRELLTTSIVVNTGTNLIKQSLGHLPAGVYIVRVQSVDNAAKTGQTVRFLKQ